MQEKQPIKRPGSSFGARSIAWVLKTVGFKKIVEKRVFKPISRSGGGFVPKRIQRAHAPKVQEVQGKTLATFPPQAEPGLPHVIFLHGGAYVFEANALHWVFAEKLAKASGCRITLVDYPLAPEHSYRQTFRMMREAYEKLLDQFPEDSFILMGDSAGGGLALAFAQQLAAENHSRLPVKNVLLSPWLDLSMSNPENEQYVASDHVLTLRMLREAGLKYAAGDDRDQHLLSPINGKLEGLPPTLVFYSTQELFCADCRKLRKMTESLGNFHFREYPGMQHDWPILPIPERERVIVEICEFLTA